MIVVTGSEGSSEYEAALELRSALVKLWPGCETTPADEEFVRIAAGTKVSGYKVSDIDILVAAKLRPGRAFVPRRVLRDRNGVRIAGGVQVINFVAAIEVKDHDASRIKVIEDSIAVRYVSSGSPKWSDAVQQNINQVHTVKAYFEHQQVDLFVYRAVIMRGLDKTPCSGALGRNFDGAAFLTALGETSPLRRSGNHAVIRSATQEIFERVLQSTIFRMILPTSLDRKRMDRIVTRCADIDGYLATMGTKMLRLRGRGGTGKTVMLLQLAWRAYEERAERSLVLTYNHALTSDIRRLLTLMHVPSHPSEGGVAVRTVISFLTSWLIRLGVVKDSEDWFSAGYESHCVETLELIRQGALTSADVEAAKLAEPETFAFDYIIADEAQDWPRPELELIKALYEPERLCLADGVDQLIRSKVPSNWESGVPENRRETIPLKRCLRMKANLAVFTNTLAELANINWRVEPNKEAGGGRVIIVTGTLANRKSLFSELLYDARRAGNEAIDFLICVPPSSVVQDSVGVRSSQIATTLKSWSFDVWDGTDENQRRDFPRTLDCLRVVQYASCRGLEGWTVFLEGFDQYWAMVKNEALLQDNALDHARNMVTESSDMAWRHCLIPLSRAIDTLVISIDDLGSEASKLLLAVAHNLPDIVEILGSPTKESV